MLVTGVLWSVDFKTVATPDSKGVSGTSSPSGKGFSCHLSMYNSITWLNPVY